MLRVHVGVLHSDEGAVSLAVAMRHGVPSLRSLALNSNNIGDVGSLSIAGALFGTSALAGHAAPADEQLTAAEPAAAEPAAAEPAAAEATESSEVPAPAADASTTSACSSTSDAAAAEAGGGGAGGGGGGESGNREEEEGVPLLEAIQLAHNRISNDGLNAICSALGDANALSCCPQLRVFDVRDQRPIGPPLAAGSGRCAAAVKQAAEVAAASVSVALARLAEEEPPAVSLAIIGTSPDDAAYAATTPEGQQLAAQARQQADAEEVKQTLVESAALGSGDVTAETVEAAAKAAESYWLKAASAKAQAAEEAEAATAKAATEKAQAEAKAKAEAAAKAAQEAQEAQEAAAEALLAEGAAAAKASKAAAEQATDESAEVATAEQPPSEAADRGGDAAAPAAEAPVAEAPGAAAAPEVAAPEVAAPEVAAPAEAEATVEATAAEVPPAQAPSSTSPVPASEAAATAPDAAESSSSSSSNSAVVLSADELQLGRSIATGAFAEVFRGLLWGGKVAVKQLKAVTESGETKAEEVLQAELLHETRVLAKLSHPHILTLIGYTPTPAQIVLEALDGTVYDLVYGGVERCDGGMLSVLSDILSGCAYLHALPTPLLHRDLKPPNVLHDERLRCKLCDFGTAIELRAGAPPPTEWMGSALYVAPEVDAEQPYGLPADVFSFGVLACELYHQQATGANFYGEGFDLFDEGGLVEGLEVLRGPLVADPPEEPARPDVCDSDAVWALLMRCVRATPSERPSFAEVARELSDVRTSLVGGALAEWL